METKVEFYSDGDIEDKIIETLKAGKDVFDIPYSGGAVFHNFTDARENLINWYPFEKDAAEQPKSQSETVEQPEAGESPVREEQDAELQSPE
mgnify:CR=1 FL=1